MYRFYFYLVFICYRPFVDLPKNFIVAEANSSLSNGVFQFEAQGKGHEFVKEMLIDLAYNYNGIVWAANGPQLFMRTYRKFCNYSEVIFIIIQLGVMFLRDLQFFSTLFALISRRF